MLQILSEDMFPGMVLARAILDDTNRVLLARGQVLTEHYIKRIREMQVPVVFVEDGLGLEDTPGPVSWETAVQAAHTLKSSYESCVRTGQLQMGVIRSQVDQIIEELLSNRSTMIGIAGLKSHDEYTYLHSVHVCVMAVMMGISMGFPRPRVQELGLGAILHDIGKIFIPLEVLNKPEALNEREWDLIKNHTWEGFNLMRRSEQVSLLSAHVALQHHERMDGSGYPRRLTKDDIHDYAQITAVADIFDALVSDRPYRVGFSNQEALDILEEYRDVQLNGSMINCLKSHVNAYPSGTVVELSTGDIAVVSRHNGDDNRRPVVKLMFSSSGKPFQDITLNLAESETIFIKKVLDRQESGRIASQYLRIHTETDATA